MSEAEIDVATITIIQSIGEDDSWVTVHKPDEMNLIEALGMLEMAKATLLEDSGGD